VPASRYDRASSDVEEPFEHFRGIALDYQGGQERHVEQELVGVAAILIFVVDSGTMRTTSSDCWIVRPTIRKRPEDGTTAD